MILIKTYEELNHWLKQYHYFEDGHMLKIDTNPFAITAGIMIRGTFEANTEKEVLCFKITPGKILSCDYSLNHEPSEDHYIESIEALKVNQGIGLQIFNPPTLTLIAESFTISDGEIIKSIFQPWISRREISVRVPMHEIPKPHFWKQEFKKLGYDIVFRYYAGEGKPFEQLPYPNYSGFFFQLESRVRNTQQGIFIQHLSIENGDILMYFQQCDADLDLLWTALTTILADIPDIKISCGNCKFTGDEWKRHFAINPEPHK